jgi:hypothetical protein
MPNGTPLPVNTKIGVIFVLIENRVAEAHNTRVFHTKQESAARHSTYVLSYLIRCFLVAKFGSLDLLL